MDWTEDAIARLRDLWAQGLSTAKIGGLMGISKNAVVGKAHRLRLPPRPSPIRLAASVARRTAVAEPVIAAIVEAAAETASRASMEAAEPVVEPTPSEPEAETAGIVEKPVRAPTPDPVAVEPAAPEPVAEPAVEAPKPILRRPPALRPLPPAPRARSTAACCWPIGEPGTPQFHFCDAEAAAGRPYCAEHVQIAYVRVRDRREDAA